MNNIGYIICKKDDDNRRPGYDTVISELWFHEIQIDSKYPLTHLIKQ